MDGAEHLFREFLRDRKLKYTTERMAILRAAQRVGRPFEAEELLLGLRESEYRISKATIYRTLKHLLAAQLIRQVHFGASKQAHYEFVGGEAAHDHLIDLETGQILPFANAEIVALRERIAHALGFEALSHRFQIQGRRLPPSTPEGPKGPR